MPAVSAPAHRTRLLLLAGLVACCTSFAADSQPPPAGPKSEAAIRDGALTVAQILEWLPADTETLLVCRGPFQIESQKEDGTDEDSGVDIRRVFEALSIFPLFPPEMSRGRSYLKLLEGQRVLLAVEGARRFRIPTTFGPALYDGCHVVVFEHDLGESGRAFRDALVENADDVEVLSGHETFLFEENQGRGTWTLCIARPKPNILLFATSRRYLRAVLGRMDETRRTGPRAMPDSLLEWQHVDRSARTWAIRHYEQRNSSSDPTSPFGSILGPAEDPHAVGFTFVLDAQATEAKKGAARLTYISANAHAAALVKKEWSLTNDDGRRFAPAIRQSNRDVHHATVQWDDNGSAADFLLTVLKALGHMVWI